jgi:hypothetical protein
MANAASRSRHGGLPGTKRDISFALVSLEYLLGAVAILCTPNVDLE